jgi:flagellar biosynthesis component FlhA
MGFTLPGINFRDNSSFEKNQYRFRIRGVPFSKGNLTQGMQPAEQRIALARQIENVARKTAAQFYSSRDVYLSLRNVKAERSVAEEIQKDSAMLSELTWVVKDLLSQQISIADFGQIVSEFRRCRSLNLDLQNTREQIRNLLKGPGSLQE